MLLSAALLIAIMSIVGAFTRSSVFRVSLLRPGQHLKNYGRTFARTPREQRFSKITVENATNSPSRTIIDAHETVTKTSSSSNLASIEDDENEVYSGPLSKSAVNSSFPR